MIRLLFVGDGPRDEAILSPIVGGILQTQTTGTFRSWKSLRLHGTGRRKQKGPSSKIKGYRRKLRYARGIAAGEGLVGVVAIVDADRAPPGSRLRKLRKARKDERAAGYDLPIAVGEAKPHTEAWLLDDAQAVRSALTLGEAVAVPPVRNLGDAKGALEALLEASSRGDEPKIVWADIAAELVLDRCPHAKRTGFAAFAEDVKDELGPVAQA